MNQKPTVGRIVRYTPDVGSGLSLPWAAIITFISVVESTDGIPLVNLAVFDNFGEHRSVLGIEFSEEPEPGCWSWPPRSS